LEDRRVLPPHKIGTCATGTNLILSFFIVVEKERTPRANHTVFDPLKNTKI